MGINHQPGMWHDKITWIIANTKRKGCNALILKLAVTETIHEIWHYRNSFVFNSDHRKENVSNNIINCIVYKGWRYRKIQSHIARLMIES